MMPHSTSRTTGRTWTHTCAHCGDLIERQDEWWPDFPFLGPHHGKVLHTACWKPFLVVEALCR